MTNAPRSVRFPSVAFASFAEFEAYRHANQGMLDGRYLYEVGLSTTESQIERNGACAPCLRAATFTSQTLRGEQQADGRIMPIWQDQQVCDCEDRLPQRDRAVLHFAAATQTLHPWTRLLLFGRPSQADRRLGQTVQSVTRIPRLQFGAVDDDGQRIYEIPADDNSFHGAMSFHSFQHIPPLNQMLAELRRVLVPGGRLIFTVPLRVMAAVSVSHLDTVPRQYGSLPVETEGEVHEIGWDIIDRLHDVGFDDVQAHTYWSDELGYLGPFKMIFVAVS